MYPLIRVDKLHPDGSPRASWQGYRIEDHDGAVRIWTPARTPRVHVNGRWTPDSPFVTAWMPGESFVTACYEDADGIALYIDVVREVRLSADRFAYVDLYVDVLLKNGRLWTKDEDLLDRLTPDEARSALVTRDHLMGLVSSHAPPFSLGHERWQVSPTARALPPGAEIDLA